MKITARLWLGILILAIFSPLGLLLPEYFKAVHPFGEEKIMTVWNAPILEYSFAGQDGKIISQPILSYILSCVTGIIAIVITVMFIGKKLVKKGH